MEIFIRKWSEISGGRFDADYHSANLSNSIKTQSLKHICNIKSGKRIPKGKTYAKESTMYKYLRVDDLDSEKTHIDINSLKSIDKEIFNILKRYEIFNNEIAISNAGTIGKIFLFHNDTHNRVILTENCVKLQVAENILPKFLNIVLKMDFVQQQIKQNYIQTTIPKLAIERIKDLKIPEIPPKEIQQYIVDIMDNAYLEKRRKESEAQEILDSIDSFLLSKLGISLPPKATSDLKRRIFFVKLSEISNTRFDVEYHQHYYNTLQNAIHQGKYEVAKIRDIAFINQQLESMEKYDFINYIDLSCIEKENGFIKDTILINKDFPSRARQRVFKGDLLVSTLSGSMKAIALVSEEKENLIASTGFFVISKVKQNLLKDFLINILRTNLFQTLLKREASGSIMSSINYNDFLNLKIPLPPLSVQEKIANEIIRRKQKFINLQKEAKNILESAKLQVEKIILEGQQ
ncbi:restriction endonuclease subunit S [Helicobacter sp. 23-1045]